LVGVIFFVALGFKNFFFIRINWDEEEEDAMCSGAVELWCNGGGAVATTTTAVARSRAVGSRARLTAR
jgi:hypothetical protein